MADIIAVVPDEKRLLLRLPPDVHEAVRTLADDHERSLNWTIVRLLEEAARQPKDWLENALRR